MYSRFCTLTDSCFNFFFKFADVVAHLSLIKMAIILPRGQWHAPSAVINDAWYCMVLHGMALYCMVLHGIA